MNNLQVYELSEIDLMISNRIEEVEQNLKKINIDDELINKLSMIILSLKEDIKNIKKIDISELRKFISDELILKRIEYYQKICNSSTLGIKLDEEQKQYLLDLFIQIQNKYENGNKKLVEKRDSLNKRLLSLEKIKQYLNKLKNNEFLNSSKLLEIKDVLLNEKFDLDICIKIILSITKYNLTNTKLNDLNEDEIVLIKEETNLNPDDVKLLLNKFGYNFNDFSYEEQTNIIKFGDLENIEQILTILKKYNIKVSSYSKMSSLLIYSNGKIVETIINDIINDLQDNKGFLKKMFNLYLDYGSIFIDNKIVLKSKTKEKSISGPDIYRDGAFKNYQLNRQMFIELGLTDIPKAMEKCGFIFTKCNATVREKIKQFDLYSIPPKVYLGKLSSLIAPTPLETFEQFAEAGYLDYLFNNFSRIYFRYDNVMFYKLARAKQLKIPHNNLFVRSLSDKIRTVFIGAITKDSAEFLEVNSKNAKDVVKQYNIYDDNYVFYKFDEIVNDYSDKIILDNNGILSQLEKYKKDYFTYDFNGVTISYQKVLRLYNILYRSKIRDTENMLLYAICKNSIITKEQYQTLKEIVTSLSISEEVIVR